MFRRNPKKEQLTPAEMKQIQQAVTQPAFQQVQQENIITPTQQISEGSNYIICRKDIVREKKKIQTVNGQIIETGEEINREVVNEIYQLTRDDLLAIIRNIPESIIIGKIALQMLLQEI